MAKIHREQGRSILTLDISSTCTGYAFWAKGRLFCRGSIKVKGDYSRLLEQGRLLKQVLRQIPSELKKGVEVWVEEPFFSRKGSVDTPIKMTHGILLQVCHDELTDYCWNFVHVSTWRASLLEFKGVKGTNNLKAKAVEVSEKYYGVVLDGDHDQADALCILIWARRLYE